MYETILFVDFDGTITAEETLDGAMRLFIPKKEYEEKVKEVLEGKISLSQALHSAFDHTPAAELPRLEEYVRGVALRPGFEAFLDTMDELKVPIVVISGGLKPLVETKLKAYENRFLGMHYVDIDTSGGFIRLDSKYDDGKEVLKKTDIMSQYEYRSAICIGDGYTDIHMALACDFVFARDVLAAALTEKGIPFHPWNDFYDVAEAIKSSR